MKNNIFGTDGIRALVGSEKMHPQFIMHLGWALGKTLPTGSSVLVGKDTRISGYMFESAMQSGLSAAGINVFLLGPLPTPGIAYLTKTLQAQSGVVISASHNPYQDNGVKFFNKKGEKLSSHSEEQISDWMQKPMELVDASELGKVKRINDAISRYVEFCKSTVKHISLQGLHIAIDCANGASYKTTPLVFKELGATVTLVGANPNGLNINNGVGSTHPESLIEVVKNSNADLGLSLDGDADRCILCDKNGRLADGDDIIYLIAKDRLKHKKLKGDIVGTLMTNLGVEHALNKLGVNLIRTKVGDKYVLEQLKKNNSIVGGEPSGHILCLDSTSTGDGTIGALQVIRYLVSNNTSLKQELEKITKLPSQLINIAVDNSEQVLQSELVTNKKSELTQQLGKTGRILLRASGTEPLVRIMVEGENKSQVNEFANQLADTIMAFKE